MLGSVLKGVTDVCMSQSDDGIISSKLTVERLRSNNWVTSWDIDWRVCGNGLIVQNY